MSKISPKWIALCTAAISLTYTTGYIVTEPASASVAAKRPVQAHVQVKSSQNQTGLSGQARSSGESNTADSRSGQTHSKYKDGSYTGYGMNRIGSVTVTVTIKDGKIDLVEIKDCTTSYPESLIDRLPQQVLEQQNPDVDNVSGATESTDDFRTAVRDALSQAMS